MGKCRYCNKELVRKIYANGRKESEKKLKERIYCNRECLKKDYAIRNKSWTNDEENALREGYKKNTPIPEIAKQLNKTPSAIKAKAHDMGITNKNIHFTKEQIEFMKYASDKMTYKEIGEALGGRNYHNICRKFKELGINKTKMKSKFWILADEETKTQVKLKRREARIKNGTLNPMKNQSNPYSRSKGGKRADLNNIYFRSAWEANIARYYNYLGVKWEYEPKTFIFKNITRGSVSYTPDFYLPEEDKWIEVKGWMDGKSKTKLKRFKNQYPEEYSKLVLIQEKEYNEIKKKLSCFIKNWE